MKRVILLGLLVSSLWTGAPARAVSTEILLTPVGVFAAPVALATRPGDDALYIVEKVGLIHAIRGGVIDPVPVLDVTDEVSTELEQGLLGLAFSHDGQHMYVNLTDTGDDTHLVEYEVADGRAVEASRRDVLVVEQPFSNHNAGTLYFGPDGYLYMPLGDGGSGGDPNGNGQNLGVLLGKMLRIDPRQAGDDAYSIPPDNPFVDTPGARAEIWSYGLRNPWKFSFDSATGDIWIADVGQETWEEVNMRPASSPGGENYGWNSMEGTHPYEGGIEPENHVPPVHEYGQDGGKCSITGGFVYRGSAIPSLAGSYLYGDWCEGSVRALRLEDGEVVSDVDLELDVPLLASFGEDADGELYAISLAGPVFRLDPMPV